MNEGFSMAVLAGLVFFMALASPFVVVRCWKKAGADIRAADSNERIAAALERIADRMAPR